MYVHLVLFNLGPGMQEKAEKIASDAGKGYPLLNGFKGVTFFGDSTVGEYGSMSLWESLEDLQNALKISKPRLDQDLSGLEKAPRKVHMSEVYQPTA
jgi:heme-degrading monooxygenase HmoA